MDNIMELNFQDSNDVSNISASSESNGSNAEPIKDFLSKTNPKLIRSCPVLLSPGKMWGGGNNSKPSLREYILGRELGRGAFGVVYYGKHRTKDSSYAIKVLEKEFIKRLNKVQEVLIEREILRTVDHPNIIKLHAAFQTKEKLYYVLEYASNRDLSSLIRSSGVLHCELAQFYSAEIVHVLDYLHNEKGIAHRDLKPENIMLDSQMKIKLIDFSTAIVEGKVFDIKSHTFLPKETEDCEVEDAGAEEEEEDDGIVGTAEYMSPEMISHCVQHSPSTDLWALGCIIYQFFHGRSPFKGINDQQTLDNVKTLNFSFKTDIPEDAKDLISKLLVTNPSLRIGYKEKDYASIKQHPFFHGIHFDELPTLPVPFPQLLSASKGHLPKATFNDSIISDPSLENSFESCDISKLSVQDGDVPSPFIKQNSARQLINISEFSIDSCGEENFNIIDDYLREKIDNVAKSKCNETGIVYEGIATRMNFFEYRNKLKLYSNRTLEIWDYKKNVLIGTIQLNSNTKVFLGSNFFEIQHDNGMNKFRTTECEAMRWYHQISEQISHQRR